MRVNHAPMHRALLSSCLCWAVLLSVTTPTTTAASDSDETYTAAWLRRGCALTESLKAEGKAAFDKWDSKQMRAFYGVADFYHGFMRGINNVVFQFERGSVPKSLFPPEEWQTWGNVAPQILNFMQKHKDVIRDETPASDILAAWVWSEHPDSTDKDKAISRVIIRRGMADQE